MPRRAPGRYWRQGLSLLDLYAFFPTETTARDWFAR